MSRGTVHPRASLSRAAPRLLLSLWLLAAGVPGCASPARVVPERDLRDPVPAVRARAVREVARTREVARVPDLIEMLDDEDPGVRVLAGATLRDLTGHDTGYDASAPASGRREQVLAWRAWWQTRPAAGTAGRVP